MLRSTLRSVSNMSVGILIALGIPILLGMMILSFFLAATQNPVTAQDLRGETPTIPLDTPTSTVTSTATPEPVPVGGDLAIVNREAVLRRNLRPLLVPLTALVILVGIIGLVVIRGRPTA